MRDTLVFFGCDTGHGSGAAEKQVAFLFDDDAATGRHAEYQIAVGDDGGAQNLWGGGFWLLAAVPYYAGYACRDYCQYNDPCNDFFHTVSFIQVGCFMTGVNFDQGHYITGRLNVQWLFARKVYQWYNLWGGLLHCASNLHDANVL